VETNNPYIVRIWLEHGANVNARDPKTGLPLLAFAIINSARFIDSISMFSTLLAYGADALAIPTFLYSQNVEAGVSDQHYLSNQNSKTDKHA